MRSITLVSNLLFSVLLAVLACLGLSRHASASTLSAQEMGLPPRDACDTIGANGTPFNFGYNCRTMVIDGFPRTYIVYVPQSVQQDAPVVFLFHGTNGDGDGYLRKSGWIPVAKREGVVLVAASGLYYCPLGVACADDALAGWETKWHHYHLYADYVMTRAMPNFPATTAQWPVDDVDFTERMMDDVTAGLQVDETRFYASGFSSGAAFTARLAVEIPDRLAAVSYSSAGIISPSVVTMTPASYIPVFALIGTRERGIAVNANLSEPVPLDPAEFLDLDGLMDYFVIPHLETFKHHYSSVDLGPVETLTGSQHTLYRWRTGHTDQIFQLAALQGLEHTAPNGCDEERNPQGWEAAEIHWQFFTAPTDDTLTPVPAGIPC